MATAFAACFVPAVSQAASPEAVPASGAVAWQSLPPRSDAPASISDLTERVGHYPDSTAMRRALLKAQLDSGDADGALASLAWLKARGYAFSERTRDQIAQILAEHTAADVDAVMAVPITTIAASRAVDSVPADALLVEAAIRAPANGALYATTVLSQALFTDDAKGEWRAIHLKGVDALGGIVADAQSGLLWISSGVHDPSKVVSDRFHGVLAFDPESGKEIARIAAPHGVYPADITLGAGGVIYASDPYGGGVYWAKPGDSEMQALVPPGTFRSPQGLAEGADGDTLYVSDFGYGIAVIDLAGRSIARVELAEGLAAPLDGIDGLWRLGHRLIAIQNGLGPARIAEFQLSPNGLRIDRGRILEQAHPEWTEPLGGAIYEGELLYISNGQWGRFDQNGQPDAINPPEATQIRALPLEVSKH